MPAQMKTEPSIWFRGTFPLRYENVRTNARTGILCVQKIPWDSFQDIIVKWWHLDGLSASFLFSCQHILFHSRPVQLLSTTCMCSKSNANLRAGNCRLWSESYRVSSIECTRSAGGERRCRSKKGKNGYSEFHLESILQVELYLWFDSRKEKDVE